VSGRPPGRQPRAERRLPAPASPNELALLRFPDRRTAWVVVAAVTLTGPVHRLEERLAVLHRAVPMTGARLRGEVWHPGSPPDPLIADGDPLHAPALLDRFDLADQPPFRIVVGSEGHRLAVACHHAAFDGRSLVALLAALAGGVEGQPGGVDNLEHPVTGSATLPLRGAEPRRAGLNAARVREEPGGAGPGSVRPGEERPGGAGSGGVGLGWRLPELRGLVGRMVRPADRVAASPGRHVREALAVREVRLGGAGVTARLAEAAMAAAGARNARMGRPWRRVGINIGLAGRPDPAGPAGPGDVGGAVDRGGAVDPGRGVDPGGGTDPGGGVPIGNYSRYRRLDLRPGEPVGPMLAAALAGAREPLDQVWSPRLGWVLEPVVGRFSDSLLVSNLGRCVVPGANRVEFFPVARGRSAVAVGAAGLAGGLSTVSVRARDLSSEDAEALLEDLVARLTGQGWPPPSWRPATAPAR
jgi:hypothetical protein